MLAIVESMALHGLTGYLVNVQIDVSPGLPHWEIVGLPDTSVRESKERVRTAIKNSGIEFPSRRITVNLAPANTKKEGSFFDLPIAIGILLATENLQCVDIEGTVFMGELSLDGTLNKINGVLPMCIEALKLGIKRVILPAVNAKEASVVNGLEVIGVRNLSETIKFLTGERKIKPEHIDVKKMFEHNIKYDIDFAEVKGQENVKRALEIAAAGGHNCVLIGSPGVGKTMLARRLPSILPDLSFDEALEVSKIHSIAGVLNENSLVLTRPFRAPHHTISSVALVGGGRIPKPRRNKPSTFRGAIFG